MSLIVPLIHENKICTSSRRRIFHTSCQQVKKEPMEMQCTKMLLLLFFKTYLVLVNPFIHKMASILLKSCGKICFCGNQWFCFRSFRSVLPSKESLLSLNAYNFKHVWLSFFDGRLSKRAWMISYRDRFVSYQNKNQDIFTSGDYLVCITFPNTQS